MFTIDASVWINGFIATERGHAESRALLELLRQRPTTPVVVPTLVRTEVAGAVSRVSRDPATAERFAAEIVRLPFVRVVPVTATLAADAATLAADRALRGADAVCAAVARRHGCTLVSLDNEHLTRLGPTVAVLTPAAALSTLASTPPPTP